MTTSRTRWLALPLMGACCMAGYAAGSLRNTVRTNPEELVQVARPTRAGSPHLRTESNALGEFEKLLSDSRKDMNVWKVVSRIPLARLPEAFRRVREAKASASVTEEDRLVEIEIALYFHWAESDPKAALADAASMPESPLKGWAQGSVLTAWMRTDPHAAYQAVSGDPDASRIAQRMLVRSWTAEQAPVWLDSGHPGAVASFMAEELAHSINDNRPNQESAAEKLTGFVTRWKSTDPQGAERWLNTASAAVRHLLIGKDADAHE